MSEIIDKIKQCKSRKELDTLRLEVVAEISKGKPAFEAAQKAFRKQKKICNHNDIWGMSGGENI